MWYHRLYSANTIILKEVPVIKDFTYMCKRIKQGGRALDVIHGEIVPNHDKLGERNGKSTQLSSYFTLERTTLPSVNTMYT